MIFLSQVSPAVVFYDNCGFLLFVLALSDVVSEGYVSVRVQVKDEETFRGRNKSGFYVAF